MVDGRIGALQAKIDAAREREGVLSCRDRGRHATRSTRSRTTSTRRPSRLDQLETVLALHQRKLDRLNELYALQTRKLDLPPAPARGGRGAAEQAARRDLHLRAHVLAVGRARLGQLLRHARPARVPEHDRPPGPQDRAARSRRPSCRCRRRGTRPGRRAGRSRRRPEPSPRAPPSSAPCATGSPGASASSRRPAATSARRSRLVREDKEDALGHMRDLQAQSAALGAKIRSAQSSSVIPAPDRRRLGRGLHLAGPRRADERLRLALGPDARGHRHRRLERDAGRGRGGRRR